MCFLLQKWSQYESACDSYESELEKRLQKLLESDRERKEQERNIFSLCDEYSASYDLLLQWTSSRQLHLSSHDFPKTIEETQKLLEKFEGQKMEEKEKEKLKKKLGLMEQKLAEFQRRHNKEFHFPQFAQLEKVKVT